MVVISGDSLLCRQIQPCVVVYPNRVANCIEVSVYDKGGLDGSRNQFK